jgi:hypothetical protein
VATARQTGKFLDEHPGPAIGKVYRASPKERQQGADASGRVELWCPKL